VYKLESFQSTEPEEIGTVQLPNSVFGLPLRKDILFRLYWYHRRKLAGYDKSMQLYHWEWPGSNKKVRSQKNSGKARMGRRKSIGKWAGVHAHPIRPKDWGEIQLPRRYIWKGVKAMLSTKYAQGSLKIVDNFNVESHKTKYMVHHLRKILGRRCRSALLVHEGNVDINDNARWACAQIPSVRRENVEGVNVYKLLRYHQLVITEAALTKLLKVISNYPHKHGWVQRFATPDGRPAPVPQKVPGWNSAWIARKERLVNAEFRAREFFQETHKWKWSPELKGPLKVPRHDLLAGFRIKDFMMTPEKPIWDKLESLYADDEPLEDDIDIDEFDDLVDAMDGISNEGEDRLIEDVAEIRTQSLKSLADGWKLRQ